MIDFLCIGAQKSGTSWFSTNIEQHPQVWSPFTKEIHYFDVVHLGYSAEIQLGILRSAIRNLRSKATTADQEEYYKRILDEHFCFTDEWYEHIFSAAPRGKVKGETTPFYSSLPAEGILHVKRMAPKVKIIYLVRDPAERAMSALKMEISRNPNISQVEFCSRKGFLSRGDYRRNISSWESFFDQDDILYIPYGRIRSDPSLAIRQVERFLNISNYHGYRDPSQRIYRGEDHKLDQAALDVIFRQTSIQNSFLENRFGIDFLRETR